MSTLYVDSIQPKTTGSIINAKGMIIQVVHSSLTSQTFSTTSNTLTDLTGLSATITPKSVNSRILIQANISVGMSNNTTCGVALNRNGTPIGVGDANGSRLRLISRGNVESIYFSEVLPLMVMDTPNTTSELTYQPTILVGSGTLYVNRSSNFADNTSADEAVTASHITLMEIGG